MDNIVQAAKYIGAGAAAIGLAGAGVNINNSCPPNMKVLGNKLTQNGETPLEKVDTVDKKYSDAYYAWIAGFFEGDGAILCYVDKAKGYKFVFRVRVIIKLSQKSNSTLNLIKEELQLGGVYLNRRKDSYLNYYDLIISSQEEVLTFINLIKPYLRFKTNQFEIALKILKLRKNINYTSELLVLAKLADSLSVLNVRSGNDGHKYAKMIKEYFNL